MSDFTYSCRMLLAILWKFWRSRKHRRWRTAAEICVPVMLVVLLVTVKAVMLSDSNGSNTLPTFFPDKNILALQTSICSIGCSNRERNVIMAYAPSTRFTDKLMAKVHRGLNKHGANLDLCGFGSEEEIEAFMAVIQKQRNADLVNNMDLCKLTNPSGTSLPSVAAAIIFVNPWNSSDFVYKIRLATDKFITNKDFPEVEIPGPGKQFAAYETTGFLGLQTTIDMEYILMNHTGRRIIKTQAFPYPPYRKLTKDHFTLTLATLLPASLVIGLCWTISVAIRSIVEEKRMGMKKYLSTIGLGHMSYWFGWFLDLFIVMLIVATFTVGVLTMDFTGEGAALEFTSATLLLTFLLLYVFSSVWFCIFVAILLGRAKFSQGIAALIWIATFFIPSLLVGTKQRNLAVQILVAVLPNMCLRWGFGIIAIKESKGEGLLWSNFKDYASTSDSLNMAAIMALLAANGLFYFLVVINSRSTSKGGKNLKGPCWLIRDVFKRRREQKKQQPFMEEEADTSESDEVAQESPRGILRSRVLENLGYIDVNGLVSAVDNSIDDVGRDAEIKIRNLRKSFYSNKVLKGINCDLYKNEITFLLGKGKTVVIKTLLGEYQADEGTIYVDDYDVGDYPDDVKRRVGLCPQHNVMFKDLTVMEHLVFFGWMKGNNWNKTLAEARQAATILKLKDHLMTPVESLTLAEQRLLNCAIALMGKPKVAIFDDPTRGMDLRWSKTLWDALRQYKQGRTIIVSSKMTIHDAIEVGDRIALLHDGQLWCSGTTPYSKKVFDQGYMITLNVSGSGERLVRMICQEIKQADVKHREPTVDGESVSIGIPKEYNPLISKVFYQLYDLRSPFKITNAQIRSTSFEDIFHSAREMKEFTQFKQSSAPFDDTNATSSFFEARKTVGWGLLCLQFIAILQKSFHLSYGKVGFYIFQVAIPVTLVLAGITGCNQGFRNYEDRDHYGQIKIGMEAFQNPMTLHDIRNPDYKAAYSGLAENNRSSLELAPSRELQNALLRIGETDVLKYRRNYIVAAKEDNDTITAMYSTVPLNSAPLSINRVTNALLRMFNSSSTIVVENHPLRNSSENKEAVNNFLSDAAMSTVVKSFCFCFAFAFASVAYAVAKRSMHQRISGSHHLQIMTGVNPVTFWTSQLILDAIYVTFISGVVILIVYLAEERNIFTAHGGGVALFQILFWGGLTTILFAYTFSQLVTDDSGIALGFMNVLHLLAAMASYAMYYIYDGVNNTISDLFFWATTPFPIPFTFHSFYLYTKIAIENSRCEIVSKRFSDFICNTTNEVLQSHPAYGCCESCQKSETDTCFQPQSYFMNGIDDDSYTLLGDLVILASMSATCFAILILNDYGFFQKLQHHLLAASSESFRNVEKPNEDPSAAQEAEYVRKLVSQGTTMTEGGLLVDGLCYNYGNIAAYSHVSFFVRRGQIFGLLGSDGCGKSTVFRTLGGEVLPAVGDAMIPPYRLIRNRQQFLSNVGYVRQKNSVFEGLTARETLRLFAALKGVCKADLESEVNQWLSILGLEVNADLPCEKFPPGMTRQLMLGTALIGMGEDTVLLLDEPTKDMTLVMKKMVWRTLQQLQKEGKVILLASRNVNECENLCEKIGLMINGRLQYIGSRKEIKSKFLNGFNVILKLTKKYSVEDNSDLETVKDLMKDIEVILDEAIFREAFQNELKYLIPQKASQNWGEIVEKLERIRIQFFDSVASYTMMESTLEEVFKAMAELDLEYTNELPETRMRIVGRCCWCQCCNDDYM